MSGEQVRSKLGNRDKDEDFTVPACSEAADTSIVFL